jgi:hypothetical protein
MNAPYEFSCFSDSQFIDRYEALRLEASKYFCSRENCGLGLAAFLHRGMLAWMKTWQLYQSTAVVRNPEDHDVVEVDRGVRQEVVTVLTNMILSHQ